MAEIRVLNVRKAYGPTVALRDITVTVKHGELLALLGPSGCGKTTTLQILAGFLVPEAGQVWADDRLISSPQGVVPPERRRMSLVFQSYALWPHMTVSQNVSFGLEMRRLEREESRRRVKWILEVVDLGGYGTRYPHELSGGQQQRVALARALVVQPDTLLLDEPLSNLDANLREQMRFEIRRIHRETGITMVYVTHDQAEAMVIADRIAVMNTGEIEQVGSPQDIYESPRSRFVASFIGQANCLPGHLVERGVVRCGDLQFRTIDGGQFVPGDQVVLCVRPHAVRVHRGSTGRAAGNNAAAGRLIQDAYLGDLRDLRIELPGGLQIRALLSSSQSYQVGEEVLVELPADACRLVRP
jgi:iron(III) transport system ATP-binding protein